MKLYKIIWTDASSVDSDTVSWFTVDESIVESEKEYGEKNVTVGFILHKNKRFVVVASSQAKNRYSDLNMIPTKMIVKIKELK